MRGGGRADRCMSWGEDAWPGVKAVGRVMVGLSAGMKVNLGHLVRGNDKG